MGLSPKYVTRPAAEETINDPTNNRHYWRYRMHVCLEDLLEDTSLLASLQVPPLHSEKLRIHEPMKVRTQILKYAKFLKPTY